mgnify:CR=1 FL=1
MTKPSNQPEPLSDAERERQLTSGHPYNSDDTDELMKLPAHREMAERISNLAFPEDRENGENPEKG